MEFLVISAKMIITNLSNHSIYELLEKEDEDDNVNLTYLEDYAQKFAKNGYLNKYDITQILDLTDKKSKEMTIYYQDEKSNINIETTNKNDEEMENLKNTLKAEYYKYSSYGLNVVQNALLSETASKLSDQSLILHRKMSGQSADISLQVSLGAPYNLLGSLVRSLLKMFPCRSHFLHHLIPASLELVFHDI